MWYVKVWFSSLRFQDVYQTVEDTIQAADVEEDLKWFRSNHGPGMPMNWPQFEVHTYIHTKDTIAKAIECTNLVRLVCLRHIKSL